MAKEKTQKIRVCTSKTLPRDQWFAAAQTAISVNPLNRPQMEHLHNLPGFAPLMMTALHADNEEDPIKQYIAASTSKYWGVQGVDLTVYFMENTSANLAERIVSHMNAWKDVAGANTKFSWTKEPDAPIRISRGRGGYWSYLGTDVKLIPKGQPTMNLEGFTMNTPETEYKRVVRHETGHTLGFQHEHLRKDLVNLLDRNKTIQYFQQTQGWSEAETVRQVLTPISEQSLLSPTPADALSIMCYQLPGKITKNGQPITGGVDIDQYDAEYTRRIYPPSINPPTGSGKYTIIVDMETKRITINGNEVQIP